MDQPVALLRNLGADNASLALSTAHRERGQLNPERWKQISRLFKSVISLDPEARADYLKAQCGSDSSLREEVEKLIDSHHKADDHSFISDPAVATGAPFLLQNEGEEDQNNILQKGKLLGAYLILDKLGAGGMGEVYLAKDTRLDRTVALKILPADVAGDIRRMQRFNQEARVASSLNQPNILTIFEFGEVESLTFLATEFIDGQTLRDYLRGNRLKVGEILDISIQVLAALDAAHEARIVHRDIKPENVMIRRRDRLVKVLDFGLAKLTEKKSGLTGHQTEGEAVTQFKTAPGSVMGTVNYMSPEQAQGQMVDERTDIWSTGVMVYEMVAGAMPFKGATDSHTIVEILEKDPAPLTQSGDGRVPAELDRIVTRALAKRLDERYQTAKDMLIDLRNLKKRLEVEAEIERSSAPDPSAARVTATPLHTVATTALADSPDTKLGQANRRRLVLGVVLAMLAVGAALVFGIKFWRPSQLGSTASVPATLPERSLTYSITVQKYRNKKPFEDPFQLGREMLFERDYQLRLNIGSPQSGYLYVINEGPHAQDQAPEFVVLFPSPTSNGGSALVTENAQLQIPEKSWFRLDSDLGTEKVWLVFAPNAIPELEPARAFANSRTQGLITDAALRDKIQAFLKEHSNSKPAVEHDVERKQTTLVARGVILVHVIRLEHQ